MEPNDSQWHLDKKVPLAMIMAFVIQSVTFIWIGATWKQSIDSRIDILERSDAERKPQEARLIRLEERLINMADLLNKIDKRLNGEQP